MLDAETPIGAESPRTNRSERTTLCLDRTMSPLHHSMPHSSIVPMVVWRLQRSSEKIVAWAIIRVQPHENRSELQVSLYSVSARRTNRISATHGTHSTLVASPTQLQLVLQLVRIFPFFEDQTNDSPWLDEKQTRFRTRAGRTMIAFFKRAWQPAESRRSSHLQVDISVSKLHNEYWVT